VARPRPSGLRVIGLPAAADADALLEVFRLNEANADGGGLLQVIVDELVTAGQALRLLHEAADGPAVPRRPRARASHRRPALLAGRRNERFAIRTGSGLTAF